jgi:hypothetical protein
MTVNDNVSKARALSVSEVGQARSLKITALDVGRVRAALSQLQLSNWGSNILRQQESGCLNALS